MIDGGTIRRRRAGQKSGGKDQKVYCNFGNPLKMMVLMLMARMMHATGSFDNLSEERAEENGEDA